MQIATPPLKLIEGLQPMTLLLFAFLVLWPIQSLAESIPYGAPEYTFSYPAEFHLKQYLSPEGGMLGQSIYSIEQGLPEDVLQIRPVFNLTRYTVTKNTAMRLALDTCAAKTTETHVSCTEVLYSEPFLTQELQGYRFLVKENSTTLSTGSVSSRVRGPIFVLNERVTSGVIIVTYNHPIRTQRSHLRMLQKVLGSFIGD